MTGAAGFLGAATTARFLDGGHSVAALIRTANSASRLARLRHRGELIVQPSDAAGWEERMGCFAPEAVVHLAWQGVRSKEREDLSQLDDAAWSLRLFGLASRWGARRFVGLGSQAEYGPQNRRLAEDAPTEPDSLYGLAKLATGRLVLAGADRQGTSAAWIRLFSLYGPGEGPGTLLGDLARSLHRGETLALTPCEQVWDYLFIEDAASALVTLAETDGARGIFNLGRGEAVALRHVVETLRESIRPGAELGFGQRPYPPGQILRLEADISRLCASTGWAPTTSLEAGLRALAGSAAPVEFSSPRGASA